MSSRQRWTLVAACVATFMLLIDITVVNVALPEIQRDLDASFSDLQWVIDAYALTLAAFLLTAGSAADRFGRRKVFVFGLAVFTLASLACGLAHTPLALIVSRGVQGVGGAVLFATSLALLAEEFEGRRARHRLRHLGRHHRRRGGHRPAGGRGAHRRPRLGVDLPRQPAGRPRRHRLDAGPRARVERPRRALDRRPGRASPSPARCSA